jgi:hypothetical protein
MLRLVRTELAADPTNVTYEPLVINHVVLATAVCHCANHKAPAGWRPEDTCMHSFPQSHNERLVSKQSETDHCTPSTIPFGPILDLLLPIINYRRIVPWCNYCDLHRFCTSMSCQWQVGRRTVSSVRPGRQDAVRGHKALLVVA